LGTACGNTNNGSRSGLLSRLRYRVHQLVSTVGFMGLGSRFFAKPFSLAAPVAVLPGIVLNLLRSTGFAPMDSRYSLRKAWWLNSSSVLSWMYCDMSASRLFSASV